MAEKKTVFERLSAINVNEHVEKKEGLTYLSWAWAWSVTKKACPDASYRIGETTYDEQLGFMCHTTVTIEDETLEMWLPVMDGANKSMKKQPYNYTVMKWENGRRVAVEKTVQAATTFDINKTIMRCLVKNLAMFGLGIYIYAGEDLPEVESDAPAPAAASVPPAKSTRAAAKTAAPAAPAAPTAQPSPETQPNAQNAPAPAPQPAPAAPAAPAAELATLKKDTPEWEKVKAYVESNKGILALEMILKQIQRKYKITPAIKKQIADLCSTSSTNSETTTNTTEG